MSATCCTTVSGPAAASFRDPAYRRVLWVALVVNAAMFGVEFLAGAGARSSALHADALDFLADAANYAISLFVLSATLATRAKAALLKGATMGAFGLWVVGSAVYRLVVGGVPEPMTMGAVGVLALAANLAVAGLLLRYRKGGDANAESVWICTRNDAIGNVAVTLAALGVFSTRSGWPDALVALVMAALALAGAARITRRARAESRTEADREAKSETSALDGAYSAACPGLMGERVDRGRHRHLSAVLVAMACAVLAPTVLRAQTPAPDLVARITVTVVHDTLPLEAALVRAGRVGAPADARGRATLRISPGTHRVIASRIGYRPDSTVISLRAGQDTTITIALATAAAELESVVVSATRSERRVEDVPLRVEVIDEEEIAEKVAMTPGDIAMMLNETSGLRVQTTSPSLGGASVRIQGLLGRYSLILADGLPLYGGQAGGLGLLQIPPVDLGRVEIIKGTASALYGSAALGGVVNLLSRRPGEKAAHTALVNQTTRGGTDGVAFFTGPLSERWGYTLLAGAHRQSRGDVDGDGWTDLPGYERVVARPRFYFSDGAGRTAFLTAGVTGENRSGGTLAGRVAPDGQPFAEGLDTRRADVGALARWLVQDSASVLRGAILTLRGSAVEQRHGHTFGTVREDDRHGTWFGEAAVAVPRGRVTMVGGAAIQQDRYRANNLQGFDYTFTVPALFGQIDVDAVSWLSLSTSARLDAHSEYGTVVNPRISLLLRRPGEDRERAFAGWTSRLSIGTGEFAPTPFTEETEATGLTPLLPLANLVAERATSASFDVGGPLETALGRFELNMTAFGSRVRYPMQVVGASGTTSTGASRIQLVTAAGPTRTGGGELLARFTRELGEEREGEESPALRVTGTYTYLRSTECDPDGNLGFCRRREVPLTPRHAAGVVAAIEQHGLGRLGLEIYYTGRQSLDENPFRIESSPYLILGVLGERAFKLREGATRVFVNLENLTDVRQTRHDSLVLPTRGRGGRWTTDAWTDLVGFTVNAGLRLGF